MTNRRTSSSTRWRVARRRGSALMVSLAMLIMLAVFASLFLLAGRFDMDASAADLDYVRLDLYAEGLAQYVQLCLVSDLWGFDEIPLNYDIDPANWKTDYDPLAGNKDATRTYADNPFDYFGGQLPGPDGTLDTTDDVFPDFWLTDPRVQRDPASGALVYLHPAFAPTAQPPFGLGGYSSDPTQQLNYADLDGDGRADTPWLFWKELGAGLLMRAAIRVEDTSSRININVANAPIYVDANNLRVVAELWLRQTIYPGYPYLLQGGDSVFPVLTDLQVTSQQSWEEQVGRFLSELNLLGGAAQWMFYSGMSGTVQQASTYLASLNNGVDLDADSVLDVPGRYGLQANASADSPYSTDQQVPDNLEPLLGDFDLNDPGRLGSLLTASATLGSFGPNPTYDPDGLARRIAAPSQANQAAEQDRPFGLDETFDLLSLHGLEALETGNPPAPTGEQRYRDGGALPARTRVEQLWQQLLLDTNNQNNPTDPAYAVQWRKLLTGYSWSLNLCPYGEDPYGDGSFRKLNLNTCTAEQLERALEAANEHRLYGSEFGPRVQIPPFVANFVDYRDRPMTWSEFNAYIELRRRPFLEQNTGLTDPASVPGPQEPWFEWDYLAWRKHVENATGLTWTAQVELDYLTNQWPNHGQAVQEQIVSRVSYDAPTEYRAAQGDKGYGLDRYPFIVEVYAYVPSYAPVDPNDPASKEDAWETTGNNFAVELYNPYDEPISIENYELVIERPSGGNEIKITFWRDFVTEILNPNPNKKTIIEPNGRLVICRYEADAFLGDMPGNRYVTSELVIFPEARVRLQCRSFEATAGVPAGRQRTNKVVLDELPSRFEPPRQSGFNTLIWQEDPEGAQDISRWDEVGGFWFQYNNVLDMPAWIGPQDPTPPTPTLGGSNNLSPPNVAYYAVPAIANRGSATFLSPVELCQILHEGPNEDPGDAFSFAVNRLWWSGADLRPGLFHRWYMPNNPDGFVDTSNISYAGVFQALMDFVTVADFTDDSVDNDGNGITDWSDTNNNGIRDDGEPIDRNELRVPGRLNLNTVADWRSLDQLDLLINVSASDNPDFWRRLFDYRDKRDPVDPGTANDWYFDVSGRRNTIATPAPQVRDASNSNELEAFLGFEQLGEVCNVQNINNPAFEGFWEDRNVGGVAPQPFLLPAQHMRRFARNANMLSVRSDTYMVTMRVEIVRPLMAGPSPRVEVLGQRDYMYLIDRSYCVEAPQQASGQWNPDFVPPRVWRMALPRYFAY